jgi:hypothetical protein
VLAPRSDSRAHEKALGLGHPIGSAEIDRPRSHGRRHGAFAVILVLTDLSGAATLIDHGEIGRRWCLPTLFMLSFEIGAILTGVLFSITEGDQSRQPQSPMPSSHVGGASIEKAAADKPTACHGPDRTSRADAYSP